MSHCLSELELELSLLPSPAGADPERPRANAAHLAGCARCSLRLSEMKAEGEDFERFVFPATAELLVARRRGGVPWRWTALVALPAAAAIAALVALPAAGPKAGYSGTKGPALTLTAYGQWEGAARPLRDGERVPATAALRFRVQADHACHLWLVSVDQTGVVSQLYPAEGSLSSEKSAGGALPGGALLDGRPGPERLFAVCSDEPIALSELSRALRGAVPASADGVRAARTLADLPAAGQATILLEKSP